ncbi:MAG: glycosyltransferase [Bdellovibrionales bacterium]|nr:glycosyltransferase [Bdellovibrionales bacterium]
MEVHQLVHTLNYGDAISGEALAIQRMLRAEGIGGSIISIHAHEKVRDKVVRWAGSAADRQRLEALSRKDAVILHYSIASPLNDLYRGLQQTTRAIIYHNLTPTRWFRGYNDRVVRDLEKGIAELPELVRDSDIVLADSTFNLQELQSRGATGGSVLPLMLDEEKWAAERPNEGIRALLSGNDDVHWLHVGRLAPNKCIEDIIRAFYFYHHKINRRSRLWLVGIDIDTELYAFELRRLISRLQLREAVSFVGAVADCELRAFYENCSLYMCMSEHEGFCLPLLEAMHFGLPVVAFNACAVGETVGDGGVLVEDKQPAELAELANAILTNGEIKHELIERGKQRARAFGGEHFRSIFRERVLSALMRADEPQHPEATNAHRWA